MFNIMAKVHPQPVVFEPDTWFSNMVVKLDALKQSGVRVADIQQKLKVACKELRYQKDKYQALSEASECGIIIYRDEKVIVVNPVLEELLGYTEKELMDNIELLNKCYNKDDLAIVNKHKYSNDMSPYSVSIIHKNGGSTKVCLRPKMVNFNGQGQCRAVCVTKYVERLCNA